MTKISEKLEEDKRMEKKYNNDASD